MAAVTMPPAYAEAPELGVLALLAASRSGLDARLIEAAVLIVGATGRELLADKGFVSVSELTLAQRRKWRAEAKRLACAEIEVKLGLGVYEARALVGLASAPETIRELIIHGLDRGWATWAQMRAFWERCGALDPEAARLVAESLVGQDPSVAARERLGPDGSLRDGPWQHAAYRDALEREARAGEGEDVAAERERRRAAYAARRAGLTVHDDGTATLFLTGPMVTLCAVHTRIDRVARLLRKHGDPRTLDQLRTDVAGALLLHGSLPQLDQDADDLTVGDLEELARIVNAQPAVHVQVVVPWDSLAGTAVHPHTGGHEAAHHARGKAARLPGVGEATHALGTPEATRNFGTTDATNPTHNVGTTHATEATGVSAIHRAEPRAARRGSVGQLLGAFPAYLSPGHARELALTPGATVSRLLTDPADGRLIERSIRTYRPDAAMRRQIIAADVVSRGPGSRQPLVSGELDHVAPWGRSAAGQTSELNLVGVGKRHHDLKTKAWWSSAINERRDLTWSTLLSQTVTTRVHDYRQYLSGHGSSVPTGTPLPESPPPPPQPQPQPPLPASQTPAPRPGTLALILGRALDRQAPVDVAQRGRAWSERSDLDDRRDLANRALYAAIAHRGAGALLADHDDEPGTGEHGGPLAGWLWVTSTHPRTGRRRPGPPVAAESVEQVLDLRREGPSPASCAPTRPGRGVDARPGRPRTGRTPRRHSPDAPPPF